MYVSIPLFLRTAECRSVWALGRTRAAWKLSLGLRSPGLCSARLSAMPSVHRLSQLLCPVTELAGLQFTQLQEMDHSSQVHVLVEENNQAREDQALVLGSVCSHR